MSIHNIADLQTISKPVIKFDENDNEIPQIDPDIQKQADALIDPDSPQGVKAKQAEKQTNQPLIDERQLVGLILHDAAALKELAPFIKPAWIVEDATKQLATIALEYWKTYAALCPKEVVYQEVADYISSNKPEIKEFKARTVEIYNKYNPAGREAYTKTRMITWAKKEAVKAAMLGFTNEAKTTNHLDLAALRSELAKVEQLGNDIAIMSAKTMIEKYPSLREPLIDGLLRIGEVMNIVAAPKARKSWLLQELIMAIAAGTKWLNFPTKAGKVLMIDNELHPETLTFRLNMAAKRLNLPPSIIANIDVLSLRGRLLDIDAIGEILSRIEKDKYQFISIDAFYRTLPETVKSESENSEMTKMYNKLDQYAAMTGAAIAVVVHLSKGNQSEKSVTDSGSGAGSQSRAADVHLVLRQHEEDGVLVMEAVVRSFPNVAASCWQWDVIENCFVERSDLDPAKLKSGKKKKEEKEPWTPLRFASAYIYEKPKTLAVIKSEVVMAGAVGLSERAIKTFLEAGIDAGLITKHPAKTGPTGCKEAYSSTPLLSVRSNTAKPAETPLVSK